MGGDNKKKVLSEQRLEVSRHQLGVDRDATLYGYATKAMYAHEYSPPLSPSSSKRDNISDSGDPGGKRGRGEGGSGWAFLEEGRHWYRRTLWCCCHLHPGGRSWRSCNANYVVDGIFLLRSLFYSTFLGRFNSNSPMAGR